jgi:hypothetical protein
MTPVGWPLDGETRTRANGEFGCVRQGRVLLDLQRFLFETIRIYMFMEGKVKRMLAY